MDIKSILTQKESELKIKVEQYNSLSVEILQLQGELKAYRDMLWLVALENEKES